jgi:Tol biopolymer transport system component
MMRFIPRWLPGLAALACSMFQGCSDSTAPGIGSIKAVVSTTAAPLDRDSDGYILTVDGDGGRNVDVDGVTTIAGLPGGTHLVGLSGLAANCTVGGNPRSVDVAGGKDPVTVVFFVTCTPKRGTVHIIVATTGTDLDADGYELKVTGLPPASIPANGAQDMLGVQQGPVVVELRGISANCAVAGTNPQTVSVPFDGTVDAEFAIHCVQAGGLQVTSTTIGDYLDPRSYSFETQLRGDTAGKTNAVPSNGAALLTGLLGDYVVTLLEVPANCEVTDTNPRAVTVVSGSPTQVGFNVICSPPEDIAYVLSVGTNSDIYVIGSNGSGMQGLTGLPTIDQDPAWSPDGTKIAFTSNRDGNPEIYTMTADGSHTLRLTTQVADDRRPTWSPDGTKIAFASSRDGNGEIYVMGADGSNQTRLTRNDVYDSDPAWSPDGSKIAFSSNRDGIAGIWVVNADGSNPVRLTSSPSYDNAPAWSPDGTRLAFSRVSSNTADIFLVQADGSRLTQLTHGIDNATDPSWSPDGHKIAIGALLGGCSLSYYYYYDYCVPYVVVVSLSGVPYAALAGGGSDPAWRSR